MPVTTQDNKQNTNIQLKY